MIFNYYIYLISIGKARYVGSTKNYKRRMNSHLKDLKNNTHCNDFLQLEFNKGHKFKSEILLKSYTLFNRQVLLDEQRLINRYSNCNEAVASSYTHYSKKEALMDFTDFIIKNWKIISVLLFIICLIGFNMTPDQAQQFIQMLVAVWSSQ